MRISDWSSDVCSSDLFEQQRRRFGDAVERGARRELARVGQRGLVHIVAFAGQRAAGERGQIGGGDFRRNFDGGGGRRVRFRRVGQFLRHKVQQDRKSTRLNSSH